MGEIGTLTFSTELKDSHHAYMNVQIVLSHNSAQCVENREILFHWKKIRQILSLVKPMLSRNFSEKV